MRFWADRPRDGGPAHKLVRRDDDACPQFWDWRSDRWVDSQVLIAALIWDTNLDLISEAEVPAA